MFPNTQDEVVFELGSYLADIWKGSNLDILNTPHFFERPFYEEQGY